MAEDKAHEPAHKRRARRSLLLLAACCALLGCAASRQMKDQTLGLAQMMRWLPGTYSNLGQHEADVRAGKPPHEALAIAIVPIDSPIMGLHTFYLQEMAADDPRRVMLQEVLAFEVTDRGQIKESVARLAEPRRWRDGHLNPELFTAMVLEDLVPMSGCDLFWVRSGEAFVAANEPVRCHAPSPSGEAAARTRLTAELNSTEFALAEQSYDANGALLQGRADDPLYRFRKGAK
jgi:hypothetical protein